MRFLRLQLGKGNKREREGDSASINIHFEKKREKYSFLDCFFFHISWNPNIMDQYFIMCVDAGAACAQ